ncbi:MAG: 3D domain-containing protein [Clostridia bacterium]|nr:3D domain-containing protein [Clostridia bacterium]
MDIGEAESRTEPRSTMEAYRTSRRSPIGYLIIICILLVTILTLGVNNFILYKSYNSIQQQFHTAFKNVKSMTQNNQQLGIEKQKSKKENQLLKAKYETVLSQNQEIIKQIKEIKKQNEELKAKNKELIDDNIELQNSLKKAASVGVKPQKYTKFDGISSRSGLDRGRYIGEFVGTAYTPSKDECGNNKGITNSGKPIIPGISIAVDKKYWPFGTVFYIKGLGYAVAMDSGGAIKGKNRFDFAVFDKKFARNLGNKRWEVYLVKLGSGKVGNVKF